MTPMTPPRNATPIPMYAHVMVDMPRTVRYPSALRNLPIALLTLTFALSCATAHRGYNAAKPAVLDCSKQDLPAAAGLAARWGVDSALAGKVDWAALERDAAGLGLGAATCLYAEFLRYWKAKPTVQAMALGPQPQQDDGSAGLARLTNGVRLKLADGTMVP